MATADIEADQLTEEHIEAVRAQLLEEDDEPLETPWHRLEINLLIESIVWHLRGRTDYFAGGNMFLYYSTKQARERTYKGPDFFFVNGVDRKKKRLYWWVFDEDGRFPNVIIELASPSTIETDLTAKKELYERRFKTPEYFCYNPSNQSLLGWRLKNERYGPIEPNERGWLWSEQLQLWLGLWQGEYIGNNDHWLRFYDKSGKLLPTKAEALEEEVTRLKRRPTRSRNGKRNGSRK